MSDERKQELLELFRQTSYIPYHEALSLLIACLPERSKLIKRMIVNDIRQFKLKVYFWTMYSYGGEIPLLDPVAVTSDTLGYHVPPPSENYASFWLFGDLSTAEIKIWLQEKDITSPLLKMAANHIAAKLPKPTVPSKISPPQQQQLEITQEEAAALAGVTPRTIRNWERGDRAPQGYPGRQSRATFMAFVERRESDKRFKNAARAAQKARPLGDMNEFSEEENF